jgi:glycosyltransferase involved in cell wall biosynthesis
MLTYFIFVFLMIITLISLMIINIVNQNLNATGTSIPISELKIIDPKINKIITEKTTNKQLNQELTYALTYPYPVRSNPHFYIVIATYDRPDKSTYKFLTRALNSLKNQTYQDFEVIIVGDKYENDEEFKSYANLLHNQQITLINLEKPGERNELTGHKLWCNAGLTAMNRGIKEIENKNGEWYVHLDDDDYYTNDHLEILAENITYSKNSNFLFTQSQYKDLNEKFPHPHILYPTENNNLLQRCLLMHSSICVNIKELKTRYEISDDAADAHFYDCLKQNEGEKLIVRFIPCITVYHLREYNQPEFEERKKGPFITKNDKYFWVEADPCPETDSFFFISTKNLNLFSKHKKSYEFDRYIKNKENYYVYSNK